MFTPARVALKLQEPVVRVPADTTGADLPLSGSELFEVKTLLPHYRSGSLFLRTSGGTSRMCPVLPFCCLELSV